jgi:hypothetical protein
MKRVLFWPSSTFLLLGVLALPACGPQDTADAVAADCSGHIPREKVDSCLHRARAIDETDPTAPLGSLQADLERRMQRREQAQHAAPPDQGLPPPDMQMGDQSSPPDAAYPPPQDQQPPGDAMPEDDQPQGPPPDTIRPPDDSTTQGPGQ